MLRHAEWFERHGPFSADPHDLWATAAGCRAKGFFYRHPRLGTPIVAPFVALDILFPASRVLFSRPHRYPIADAHYAMGFCALMKGGDRSWLPQVVTLLEALVEERCRDEVDYCWGYPFDWMTCFGLWPAGTPFITSTPYAYEAFEAAYERTGTAECLAIMESVGRFAYNRIRGVELASGVKASTYTPDDDRRVVNASAYRGFVLSAAGARFGREDWMEEARASIAFVLRAQQRDGSWLYAMDGRDAFIDNIHTCFVVKNLIKAQAMLASPEVADAVQRGWTFYMTNLIDSQGLPVPFARRQRPALYRRDLYDYAETINLALLLRHDHAEATELAAAVVADLLHRWARPDGSFVTRQMLLGTNTVPYVRWAQSQAFRALALYSTMDEV